MKTLLLACGLLLSAQALAATRRVAVLVGNNAGGANTPLRYAEADAGKMARVFAEVGGLGADDLFLLQGQPLSALQHSLDLARGRVEASRRSPGDRVLLIFYFSGHSDGEAIDLGGDRLSFTDLRRLLTETRADVRVAIVDSCRSGALLAAKGATPGPAFDIRLSDDLAASGQVLLASSAADEVSLESATLGGSVFTHYLASGLRGAADSSGDGRVTLAEAYNYAYTHTLSKTAATSFGAQHAGFDYRLSGQGELVLSELATGSATLELPEGFSRAVVEDVRRDQVVAELALDASRKLAVDPGEYAVEATRDGQTLVGRFAVADGQHRAIAWGELQAVVSMPGQAKGTAIELTAPDPPISLSLFLGTLPGVASSVGPLFAGRAEVATRDGYGFGIALSAAGGSSPLGFNETAVRALAGYRFGLILGAFGLFAGPELGGGVARQSTGGSSGLGDAAIEAGARYAFNRRVALTLEGEIAAELLQVDGVLTVQAVPSVWLGVQFGLGG